LSFIIQEAFKKIKQKFRKKIPQSLKTIIRIRYYDGENNRANKKIKDKDINPN
jgi:hypothetical protein